jgi:uncharacterized membrane protein SirB2
MNWTKIIMVTCILNIFALVYLIAILHQTYSDNARTWLGTALAINIAGLVWSSIAHKRKKMHRG